MSVSPQQNPFTLRGTIREPAEFFGRREELGRIYQGLKMMQSLSVVGERRVGKSSLLYTVYQTGGGQLGDDFRVIYTDLPSVIDEATFYSHLCGKLNSSGSSFGALDGAVRGQKVVACLDEFEKVAGEKAFSRGFFDSLRSLANSGNLVLLVATQHSLADLCYNEDIRTSQFWNIFSRVDLGLLTQEEAEQFILTKFGAAGVALSDDEVVTLLNKAGRFPFFLQLLCYHFFEAKVGRAPDWEVGFGREAADHMRYLWRRLDKRERSAMRCLTNCEVGNPSDELLEEMERRGLIVRDEGATYGYRGFSDAFEDMVVNPPPGRPSNWWKRALSWFKGGKVSVGSSGASGEIEFQRPEEKRAEDKR